MNRWNLTDEIKDKYIPVLQNYLNKVENLTSEEFILTGESELGLDFSDTGINPSQLQKLLEIFGYRESSSNNNGWELDFWIDMERKDKSFPSGCEHLVIGGCGMTFELKLYISGVNF